MHAVIGGHLSCEYLRYCSLCSNCRLFMHSPVRIQSWIGTCPRKSNHPCLHAYGIHLIHKHTTPHTHYYWYDILNCSGIFLCPVSMCVTPPPTTPSLPSSVPPLPLSFYSSSPTSQFPSHLCLPLSFPLSYQLSSTSPHLIFLPLFFPTLSLPSLPLFPLSSSPNCLPHLPYVAQSRLLSTELMTLRNSVLPIVYPLRTVTCMHKL